MLRKKRKQGLGIGFVQRDIICNTVLREFSDELTFGRAMKKVRN